MMTVGYACANHYRKSAISDEVLMIACRNFLNCRFPDTAQQPIDGPELDTILLNPQQVQDWLTKKYTNYLEENRAAQEATVSQVTAEQEYSDSSKVEYSDGGLMEKLQMDIHTDEPPSNYMVTAREFEENVTMEESNDDKNEGTTLKQLLEDLFPKLCIIVPAGDILPIVRFSPARLRRDILMASMLREPMISVKELCKIWDEWTINQLSTTNDAAMKAVPSPRAVPLQSSSFSRE